MAFLTKAASLSLFFLAFLALNVQAAPSPVLDESAVVGRQLTTLGNLGTVQGVEADLGLTPPADS
ncbi:hypothetical protein P691DRAFT_774942 [Macrolepiota fuliginosa MF-IS2]|uniref:Uncharacterized protein n=1 Tax=Macrolepiota fuliginosa MF-IS2 TaxID=1400762 RepID=A0A9P6C2L1_9AGAR|nr:hypothetical protein P691DRAFT_774942 [Macrolepiota fuliginosa MF-IS2]